MDIEAEKDPSSLLYRRDQQGYLNQEERMLNEHRNFRRPERVHSKTKEELLQASHASSQDKSEEAVKSILPASFDLWPARFLRRHGRQVGMFLTCYFI